LSYRDNQYAVLLQGSFSAGIPIVFTGTEPVHTGIDKFENYLVTGPKGSSDLAYIFGSPLANKRILKGTYPAGKKDITIKGALPHPAYTCAREFTEYLEAHNISFINVKKCNEYPEQAGRPIKDKKSIKISSHTSPILANIVYYILRTSDNNYSDQLVVLMGKKWGENASRKEGMYVMYKYLVDNKMNANQFHFKDGSGLSRKNWVSGSFMTSLLTHASKSKNFKYFQSAFTGAADGDEKKVVRYDSTLKEKLWVKTGYLDGVSTFAGYVKGNSGTLYSFYFSLNNSARPENIRGKFGGMLAKVAGGL